MDSVFLLWHRLAWSQHSRLVVEQGDIWT